MHWLKFLWGSLLLIFVIFLNSCGVNLVPKTTGGILNSAYGFDDVFMACVYSVADVGFSVTSQDKTSGFLAAEREDITGEDKMNVTVKKVAGRVEVDVAIVSVGLSKALFDKYAVALQRRIADIHVVSTK